MLRDEAASASARVSPRRPATPHSESPNGAPIFVFRPEHPAFTDLFGFAGSPI